MGKMDALQIIKDTADKIIISLIYVALSKQRWNISSVIIEMLIRVLSIGQSETANFLKICNTLES